MKKQEFLLPKKSFVVTFCQRLWRREWEGQHIYLCRSKCINAIIRMHFAIILLPCRNILWHSQISSRVLGSSGGSPHLSRLGSAVARALFVLKQKNIPVIHQEMLSKTGPEGPGVQEVECKSCKCDLVAINAQLHPWQEVSQQVQAASFSASPELLTCSFLHFCWCI